MTRIEIAFAHPVDLEEKEMLELFRMANTISVREGSEVSITVHNDEIVTNDDRMKWLVKHADTLYVFDGNNMTRLTTRTDYWCYPLPGSGGPMLDEWVDLQIRKEREGK